MNVPDSLFQAGNQMLFDEVNKFNMAYRKYFSKPHKHILYARKITDVLNPIDDLEGIKRDTHKIQNLYGIRYQHYLFLLNPF